MCMREMLHAQSNGLHHQAMGFRIAIARWYRRANRLDTAEVILDAVHLDLLRYGCSERTFLSFLNEAGRVLGGRGDPIRAYATYLKPCLVRARAARILARGATGRRTGGEDAGGDYRGPKRSGAGRRRSEPRLGSAARSRRRGTQEACRPNGTHLQRGHRGARPALRLRDCGRWRRHLEFARSRRGPSRAPKDPRFHCRAPCSAGLIGNLNTLNLRHTAASSHAVASRCPEKRCHHSPLHGNLAAAADRGPADFPEQLLTPGMGARTVQAWPWLPRSSTGRRIGSPIPLDFRWRTAAKDRPPSSSGCGRLGPLSRNPHGEHLARLCLRPTRRVRLRLRSPVHDELW